MKMLIFSAITCFIGFMLGITYTVQAADVSPIIKVISIVKGLMTI